MNGGALIQVQGGEISLHCLSQGASEDVVSAQMMILRLDSFF